MIRRTRSKAFTLIELMIVIAIIAILASILIPNFVRARARSQLTGCATNLKNIGTSLEMYAVDFSSRFPVDTTKLTPNYLKVIPECPSAGSDTYSGSFSSTTTPDNYELFCEGGFHLGFTSTDYPRFSSEQGLIER